MNENADCATPESKKEDVNFLKMVRHRAARRENEVPYECVKAATILLQKGYMLHQVVDVLKTRYAASKKLAYRSVDTARRILRLQYANASDGLEARYSEKELFYDALWQYDTFLADPTCPHAVKLAAMKARNELLGLQKLHVIHEINAVVKTETTIRTVIDVAKKDPQVRDLVLELARKLPQHTNGGNGTG